MFLIVETADKLLVARFSAAKRKIKPAVGRKVWRGGGERQREGGSQPKKLEPYQKARSAQSIRFPDGQKQSKASRLDLFSTPRRRQHVETEKARGQDA